MPDEPTITPALPSDAGCWIDGHWGHYGLARLIEIAADHGWQDTEAIAVADAYRTDATNDAADLIFDAADDAAAWLNAHVAPEGFSFGWHDCEFFLWSDAQWSDDDLDDDSDDDSDDDDSADGGPHCDIHDASHLPGGLACEVRSAESWAYCDDSDDDSDDGRPSPRDLPSEVAGPVIATDHMLVGSAWEEIFPEPGGSWEYGLWESATPETATHFLIRPTCYSDYSGGTVDRSNCDALQEDYPDTFTAVYGDYGTRGLLLAADWTPPGDGRDDLVDVLAGLGADGYPVYSDEHLSRLEMEIAWEAWEQYLRHDVMRELDDLGVPNDVLDNIDDDVLRERVYQGLDDSPDPYYAESADGVVFPYLSDVLAEIAGELTPEDPAEDDDDSDAPMQCDGQMSFDDGSAEN